MEPVSERSNADIRLSEFMQKIHQKNECNSHNLHDVIKKFRLEREKFLTKRMLARQKVERCVKELKLLEQQLDDCEMRITAAEQNYAVALLRETQSDARS
jgi:hypothetical protein